MKPDNAQKRLRTGLAPVTVVEERPSVNEEERADLIGSLKEAEADIAAGKRAEYDPIAFKDRLVEIYRGKRR